MKHPAIAVVPLLGLALLQASASGPTLSFEQRVEAQVILERLRYSHQQGATRPFEEAVPRSVIEKKVLTSLRESVALEQYWGTPISEEALRQELDRIESGTLDPARLREVYAALDQDSGLILETLARTSLVERLTRNFYAFDERIHGGTRREAEELEAGLGSGAIDPRREDPRRRVSELAANVTEDSSPDAMHSVFPRGGTAGSWEALPSGNRGPEFPGIDGTGSFRPIVKKRDAFVVQTVLPAESGSSKLVTYTLPKKPWESWWSEMGDRFPPSRAHTVVHSRTSAEMRDTETIVPSTGTRPLAQISICRPDDTWDTTPFDALPRPLSGHHAVWTGTEMIVWADKRLGGFRYNPLTDTWRSMSTLGAPEPDPDPLAITPWLEEPMTTAVWTGSEMIVWDGFNVRGGRYDPETDTWRPVTTEGAPSWRTHYSVVWTGTEMIVWGGRGPDYVVNTGARYDPITDSWRPVSKLGAPAPRGRAAMLWTGERVIVWGGGPSPQADDGRIYDPVTDTWHTMSTAGAPPGGSRPAAVWADGQMFVMETTCDPRSRRYDLATDTWSPFFYLDPVWGCVTSTSQVWTGSKLIFWDSRNARGASYDPATDRWSFLSNTNAASQRRVASVVWTGELMIVWGGDAGSSGGRYDPEIDSWTPTATSSGPEERLHHLAVWTGNEMIVWGGVSGVFTTLISGGARYDVLAGQWRTLPTQDAPAWAGGSVLWTGEEMIAWEGIDSGGGRYDPISDSWRPMSKEQAPRQEEGFNMTWTGTEAILWGGYFDLYHVPDDPSPEYPRDGGMYDPDTDSWRPMSTTGAPSGRLGPATVWTGEDLIVWGGDYCYGGYCSGDQGGGRYNLFTDTWRPMSYLGGGTAAAIWTGQELFLLNPYGDVMFKYDPGNDSWESPDAPAFPWDRPVVWTGEEIVVTGGFTGGRFSPATGKWIRLSSSGTPLPRGASTAVWTGNAMIVWGGMVSAPEETATKTGGIYYLGVDLDDDGFTACQGDCNDGNAAISPTGVELPGNLFDEDCDGVLSCPPAITGGHARQLRCVTAECRNLARSGAVDERACIRQFAQTVAAMRCGDGRRNHREVCDGSDLGGATCETMGLSGGTLACDGSCNGYDLSDCESICGDGIVSGPEACDGDNTSGESCSSQGFDSGSLGCTASCRNFDASGCSTECGDGVARGHEACDIDDFTGKTCSSFGFDGGTLSCAASCGRIDLSGCTTVCGDGVRRGFELCDAADLAGMSCRQRGYQSGALGCNDTCDAFDVSECVYCGDGRRGGNEECDGADLGGQTCVSLGYNGGILRCTPYCGYTGCVTLP